MKSPFSTRELPLVLDRKTAPTLRTPYDFPGMKSVDRASREEILHRAYAIWEREGHPNDRQLANWLDAENEVMGHT
jgi:hypothetical protein